MEKKQIEGKPSIPALEPDASVFTLCVNVVVICSRWDE